MSVRRRLSERAVMKENKLGWVCLQQRRLSPRVRCRQSLMDVSVERTMNHVIGECSNIGYLIE